VQMLEIDHAAFPKCFYRLFEFTSKAILTTLQFEKALEEHPTPWTTSASCYSLIF
jgi:hypothetical protein